MYQFIPYSLKCGSLEIPLFEISLCTRSSLSPCETQHSSARLQHGVVPTDSSQLRSVAQTEHTKLKRMQMQVQTGTLLTPIGGLWRVARKKNHIVLMLIVNSYLGKQTWRNPYSRVIQQFAEIQELKPSQLSQWLLNSWGLNSSKKASKPLIVL